MKVNGAEKKKYLQKVRERQRQRQREKKENERDWEGGGKQGKKNRKM